MSCDICRPIKDGKNLSTFDSGHSNYEKVTMWKHHDKYASISIYPKHYKAHKFYKLTAINYCPYCGEDLETNNGWYPKPIKENKK